MSNKAIAQTANFYYMAFGMANVDKGAYNGWDGALEGTKHDPTNLQAAIEQYKTAEEGFDFKAKYKEFKPLIAMDAACTDTNIIKNIIDLAAKAVPGDTVAILYTGHGGQEWDKNKNELDGYDETWVAYNRQLRDDDIFIALSKFKAGVNVYLISDSCHSGSVYKEANRSATELRRTKVMPYSVAKNLKFADNTEVWQLLESNLSPIEEMKISKGLKLEIQANLFFFSGCKDNETSGDTPTGGILTNAVVDAINHYQGNLTIGQMIDYLQANCKGQTPQLSIESPKVRVLLPNRAKRLMMKQMLFG